MHIAKKHVSPFPGIHDHAQNSHVHVENVDNMFEEGQTPELGNMSVNFQTLSDENIFMVILFGINYKWRVLAWNI